MSQAPLDLVSALRQIKDPRVNRNKLHPLETILFCGLCAMLSGFENFSEMELFSRERKEWLEKYVSFPGGVPSHDTFARVFMLLNPKTLNSLFSQWTQSVQVQTQGEIIAVDGKTLRRSHNGNVPALHLVHAWACKNNLLLGQLRTNEKSNEITAVPELLRLLNIKGCVVTLDALNCQKDIALCIREQKADYVLALKGNQPLFHQDVRDYWEDPNRPRQLAAHHQTVEKDHGRIETRTYESVSQIQWLTNRQDWKDIQSLGRVESSREIKGQIQKQVRYYISSLPADSVKLAEAVRSHWQVENKVHWCLDVVFNEDQSRARKKHAASNLATLRRLALNILRQETSSLKSLRSKRLTAAVTPDYLATLLKI